MKRNLDEINKDILSLAGDSASNLGTGGMKTKLSAAEIVNDVGTDMFIINGSDPEIIYDMICS